MYHETLWGDLGGQCHGFDQTPRIGNTLANDVECRSVIDGGADDGKSDGEIHAGAEGHELQWNQPLIMVQGDDAVILPFYGFPKEGISR